MELHKKIKELRIEAGETQKQLADYLGVDVTTYAHYEAGRRTPNVEKLKMLAQKYHTDDELLGAGLPIEVHQNFTEEKLDKLQEAIETTHFQKNDYAQNKVLYEHLRKCAEPVLREWEASMELPNIDISKWPVGTVVKKVILNPRGEALIDAYLKKSTEYFHTL